MSKESFLNRLADVTFADIIDLYFIVSNLADVPICDNERAEVSFYDAMSLQVNGNQKSGEAPLGKRVF